MKSQSNPRERLSLQVPKPVKRGAGATSVGLTPLEVRAAKRVTLDDATQAHVHRRMARELRKVAVLVERVTVRFADINGKRGGIDVSCHIQLALSGLPSIVVEERAATARAAFDAAAATAERAARRSVGRAEIGARPPRRKKAAAKRDEAASKRAAATVNPPAEDGSLIGRRVGKSRANLERAAARPEKDKRDSLVDTALPGVSATDRKAGGGSTARRNTKKNLAGLTSALEDSAQDTPSRKSTRGSAGRAKRDSNLKQRTVRKLHSSKERARRNLTK